LTHLAAGAYLKASADFAAVAADEESPVRADAAYHNGIALDRLDRIEEAETWLDRAVALDPRLDAALLYRGTLSERRGDLQAAGRAYLTYLESHPQAVQAMLRFGIAAHKAGRTATARTYLEKVIATDPRSDEAVEARKYLVMWD
jgi:tetratricopeptide (TPR) repeat protein